MNATGEPGTQVIPFFWCHFFFYCCSSIHCVFRFFGLLLTLPLCICLFSTFFLCWRSPWLSFTYFLAFSVCVFFFALSNKEENATKQFGDEHTSHHHQIAWRGWEKEDNGNCKSKHRHKCNVTRKISITYIAYLFLRLLLLILLTCASCCFFSCSFSVSSFHLFA